MKSIALRPHDIIQCMEKVNEPSHAEANGEEVDSLLFRAIAEGRLAEAGLAAIARQKAKGMTVTFLRGDAVVVQHPDGHEEILGTIARRPDWTPRHSLILKTS